MTRTVCGRCEMDKCQCKTIGATKMTSDDIIQMAWEAGFQVLLPQDHVDGTGGVYVVEDEIAGMLERFAALVAAAEREACAKLCEEKQSYFTLIPCPDGISGCLVAHHGPVQRKKTATECAAAIRARGEV